MQRTRQNPIDELLQPFNDNHQSEIRREKYNRLYEFYCLINRNISALNQLDIPLHSADLAVLLEILPAYKSSFKCRDNPDKTARDFAAVVSIIKKHKVNDDNRLNMQSSLISFKRAVVIPATTDTQQCDAVNLDQNSQQLLTYLLDDSLVGVTIQPGLHVLTIMNQDHQVITHHLAIRQTLAIRKDKYSNIVIDVWEIDRAYKIGEGCQTAAYHTRGTLKFRYDEASGLHFEPDENKSVVKMRKFDMLLANSVISDVNNEFQLIRNLPDVRQRAPFFGFTSNNEIVSYMSQRNQTGKSLSNIIDQDEVEMKLGVTHGLTVDDRFQLVINMFRAAKKKIVQYNIVHMDISAGNIIVEYVNSIWVIKFIDHAFSKHVNSKETIARGTPVYTAKERLYLNGGTYSDIFSLTILASMLFRSVTQLVLSYYDHDCVFTRRDDEDWKIQFDMFYGLNNISSFIQKKLTDLFSRFSARDYHSRPTIDECIHELLIIYRDYKLEKNKHLPSVEIGIVVTHVAAKDLSAYLEEQEKLPIVLSKDQPIVRKILDALQSIPDIPLAISEFMFVLNIKCLYPATTKAELSARLINIELTCAQRFQRLANIIKLLRELDGTPKPDHLNTLVRNHLSQLIYFQECQQKTPNELDNLVITCEHIQRKCDKLERITNQLSQRCIDDQNEPDLPAVKTNKRNCLLM